MNRLEIRLHCDTCRHGGFASNDMDAAILRRLHARTCGGDLTETRVGGEAEEIEAQMQAAHGSIGQTIPRFCALAACAECKADAAFAVRQVQLGELPARRRTRPIGSTAL